MKRHVALFAVLFLLSTVAVVGCSEQISQPPAQQTTTTRSSSPTPTTAQEMIDVTLYFVKESDGAAFLVRGNRSIPKTKSVARASLEGLIKGSEQQSQKSIIPPTTKILSVNIEGDLVVIDFSKEVLTANAGSSGEALGIAQIANTLTEFPNVKRVKFLVEGIDKGIIGGKEVQDWWGHIGLADQPFSRNESLVQGARIANQTIQIESPLAFSEIGNPLTVKGRARVFEAQFNVRVLDKNDTILADESIMADDFDWGNFNNQIPYRQPKEPGRGTVLFYYYSAKDGSEVTMAPVTVLLK